MDMSISVIIPMYNSSDTIIRALDSVKEQSGSEYIAEIIVVNDGSTDSSHSIVENYMQKNLTMPIQLIDKENGGVSSARNAGMQIAKSTWIALLDSDDEWLADKIEYQMGILKTHDTIDFLGGSVNEDLLKIGLKKIDTLYKATVSDICIKNFPQPSTAVFKRLIYMQLGGFDECQKYAEDGNYFMKICASYNYYYLPKQVVIYDGGRRGFGVSGLSSNLKGMYEGNKKNINELKDKKLINFFFYAFLRAFYLAKYIRRIVITKVTHSKKEKSCL